MAKREENDNEIKRELIKALSNCNGSFLREKMQDSVRLMTYYKCAMMEIETKFKVLSEQYSLQHDRAPISSIHTRLKSFESILEKLTRKDLPMSLDSLEQNLNDVAGVRVVCSFLSDVYTIADALVGQDDVRLIARKDYIKNPKKNGYRSLHLIVEVPIFLASEKKLMKVEIQLRTIAMDCWASLEHQINYKKSYAFSEEMKRSLTACSEMSNQLDEKMDELRRLAVSSEE